MGALTWAAEWFDPGGERSADDVTDELMRALSGGIVRGSGDQEHL